MAGVLTKAMMDSRFVKWSSEKLFSGRNFSGLGSRSTFATDLDLQNNGELKACPIFQNPALYFYAT